MVQEGSESAPSPRPLWDPIPSGETSDRSDGRTERQRQEGGRQRGREETGILELAWVTSRKTPSSTVTPVFIVVVFRTKTVSEVRTGLNALHSPTPPLLSLVGGGDNSGMWTRFLRISGVLSPESTLVR